MNSVITLANGSQFDIQNGLLSKQTPIKDKNKTPKGFILFQGKSVLDGSPIVAIATMKTNNPKTGDMVQTWIIRSDMSPVEAVTSKNDSAVCGMCPHRHNLGGACYVQPFQAPLAIYNTFKKGGYVEFDSENKEHIKAFEGKSVRLGAYGDPAAVPYKVWDGLLKLVDYHTGYTHQFHHPRFDSKIADICMISCDTLKESERVQKMGFKTFRVKTKEMEKGEREIACLSDSYGVTCLDCGFCKGIEAPINIVIDVHGMRKKRFEKLERII